MGHDHRKQHRQVHGDTLKHLHVFAKRVIRNEIRCGDGEQPDTEKEGKNGLSGRLAAGRDRDRRHFGKHRVKEQVEEEHGHDRRGGDDGSINLRQRHFQIHVQR